MRGLIIAGNWKMNGLIEEAVQLVKDIQPSENHNIETIVSPPFTALNSVNQYLNTANSGKRGNIVLAAQNVFWEEKGAFTGEVSPIMLANLGCRYVIIGHSERRQYFNESNESINKKIKASLKANLKCIVCVGETLNQRENNQTFSIIELQIIRGFDKISSDALENCVIAYEPVWAIGTGKTASPEQADETHQFIRGEIYKMYNRMAAEKIKILYGGSVKPDNAKALFSKDNIDGALVGGASLKADSFNKIIRESEKICG